jgi:prepilin-type N-terminal cleavage/methylation domain-containing protein
MKLKLFFSQAGFTLVETMTALAITGIISLGAAVASIQIINQTTRDSNYTVASRQTVNALNWISRDALMAQAVEGCGNFPETGALVFKWKGWDNNACTANYTVENGELRRVYSDGAGNADTFIAGYINSDQGRTWCTSSNGTITVSITASVGEGGRVIDITKSRVISNRPKL